ncbi:MAG: DUF6580 family putative transport protein [Pirellulaceae bacterium]
MKKFIRDNWSLLAFAFFGASLIVASRFTMTDTPNFKPVAALALFSGMLIRDWRLAILIPTLGMFASDLLLGFGETLLVLTIYGSLALNTFIGRCLSKRWPTENLFGRLKSSTIAVLLSSNQFFWLTNLAVWAFTPWYSQDISGLIACLVNGIPFWKFTLAGDVVFAWSPLVITAVLSALTCRASTKTTPVVANTCR